MAQQYLSTDPNGGDVMEAAAPPPSIPRDSRGMPLVSSDTSDAPQSELMTMLGELAHPETLMDFARILTLPVDTVRTAATRALAMGSARSAAGSARSAASTGLSATGRAVEKTGAVLDNNVTKTVGMMDMLTDPIRGGAVMAGPKLIKGAGQVMQKAGRAIAPAAKVASKAAPAVEDAAPVARAASATNEAWPNQKLLNELAIAARRAKVTLSPEAEKAAMEAVAKGQTPLEAVAQLGTKVKAPAAATPPPAASTASTVAKGAKLTADEYKEFQRLLSRGMKVPEALEKVKAMRDLAAKLGGPTPSATKQAVAQRNTSGRWSER